VEIDGATADEWISAALAELEGMDNVTLRNRTMGAGVYDHGYALGYERVADHSPGVEGAPRHRLWRIRAGRIITATGAIERPLSFAGNDLPGVMLASAVRDYVVNWAVAPGKRTVIVTNNDDAYRTALALVEAGLAVPAVIDARAEVRGELPERARAGHPRRRRHGHRQGQGRQAGHRRDPVPPFRHRRRGGGEDRLRCRRHVGGLVAGRASVVALRRQAHVGRRRRRISALIPSAARPAMTGRSMSCRWCANGTMHANAVLQDADEAGKRAATQTGHRPGDAAVPQAVAPGEAPLKPVWMMPENADYAHRMKMWLDYQNDVKVSDIQLAAREGFESVEHAKRYTTLGMASDQGKLSNINGLAILSQELDEEIPQVGTTTFRPPYTPISMGAIAGEARGPLFQPLRRTPMHDWHEAKGAHWEPVGHWRRPYCYPRAGESHDQAVQREVKNTRQALGLLDASTLGKLLVRGPDAGRFVDMLYTGKMSTLKPGKVPLRADVQRERLSHG
jgi:sarcosine oxidase, subunit alpha